MARNEESHDIDAEAGLTNRLSVIESISYTVAIGFIAAMAAGLFDGMVAWK